jgi:hypothetical protein
VARAGAVLTAPLLAEQGEGAALELLAVARAEIEQHGVTPPGVHSRRHLTLQSSVAGRPFGSGRTTNVRAKARQCAA